MLRYQKISAPAHPKRLVNPERLSLGRLLLWCLLLWCLLATPSWAAETDSVWYLPLSLTREDAAAGQGVGAKAAALIESTSGRVLFLQQGQTPLPPASTSKILTAITVLDITQLDEVAQISAKAAAVGESSIHLRLGETLTVEELLKGALLRSGNDACVALAEQAAGEEALFIHWLNTKAHSLGIYDANLVNCNGLPAQNHLISALDLAEIAGYALQNQTFAAIVSSKYAEIGTGASYRHLQNTNKLLWQDDAIDGVKTGTTDAAGSCLIASRQEGDAHYVSAVLHSIDRYGESMRLLEYGAQNYVLHRLFAQGETVAALPAGKGQYRRLTVSRDCWLLTAAWERNKAEIRWDLQPQEKAEPGDNAGSVAVYDSQGYLLLRCQLLYAADGPYTAIS